MAQKYDFDMTTPQPQYTDSAGYGYDRGTEAVSEKNHRPMFFSVKVPEGNYKVSVTFGNERYAGVTALRSETRRLVEEKVCTRKGELKVCTFNVNVHTSAIDGNKTVSLQKRERRDWGWDNRLTLEFNGSAPAVTRIEVERNEPETTVWLCGNSTVTDQDGEPWTSWGQMFPYWFDERVAVFNIAMSGLTSTTFIAQNRLEKIRSEVKPGDYVVVEFGHNDKRDRMPGYGAWYNFTTNLKTFIDVLKAKGATVILVTPMERREFADGRVKRSHGDYPAAVRAVAERERLPLIDLTSSTAALYEAFGDEGSKKLFVYCKAGDYPGIRKDLSDDTHTGAFGAYETSKLVVMAMKGLGLGLTEFLHPRWKDFSPIKPDNPEDFYWPSTPSVGTKKPAGH